MAVLFQSDVYYRPSDDALRTIATESTLAGWRCLGIGPDFSKLNGGRSSRVLYHGEDVLRWLKKKRVAVEVESEAA